MEFSILTLRIIFVGLIAFVTHPDGMPQMNPAKPPKALLMDAREGNPGEHRARVLLVEGSVEGVEWQPKELGFPTLVLEQKGWEVSIDGFRTTPMGVGTPRLGKGRHPHASLPASESHVRDHSWTPGLGAVGELKDECYAGPPSEDCDVEARFVIPPGGSFETCHLAHLKVGNPSENACQNLHSRTRGHGVEAAIVTFGFCQPSGSECVPKFAPPAQALGNAKGYELTTRGGSGFVLTTGRWAGGEPKRHTIRPLRVGPDEGVVTLVVLNEPDHEQPNIEGPHWHFQRFFALLEEQTGDERVAPFVPIMVKSLKTEPMNPGWCEPYLQCLERRSENEMPQPRHLPHSPSECDEANYP